MRAIVLTLAALVCHPALALGPYTCRPAQMFGGGASVATISIGQASSCAVWACGQTMHVAVASGPLPSGLMTDLDHARVSNAPSMINGLRDKYAKDDVCTTLWDAWAACRSGLTVGQVAAICPGRMKANPT